LERGCCDRRRKRQEVGVEVEATEDGADDWHDDVVDQRINDLAEGTADDHADSQIHHIASGNKLLKFLQHLPLQYLRHVPPMLQPRLSGARRTIAETVG